jgi:hypothetical protein
MFSLIHVGLCGISTTDKTTYYQPTELYIPARPRLRQKPPGAAQASDFATLLKDPLLVNGLAETERTNEHPQFYWGGGGNCNSKFFLATLGICTMEEIDQNICSILDWTGLVFGSQIVTVSDMLYRDMHYEKMNQINHRKIAGTKRYWG